MSCPSAFANIAAYLPDMAARQPDTTALYCPTGAFSATQVYEQYSYTQLEDLSNRTATALAAAGLQRGDRTVLMVTPGRDFFALTFALFKLGAVPVLVDPGMGIRHLKTCLAEAQARAFIGIPRAHLARRLFGWAPTATLHITTGRRHWIDELSYARLLRNVEQGRPFTPILPAAEETAAILFTSGSTGIPKGVVYTHDHFLAQVAALQQIYGITPGEIDLPTFPLFALFAPALGMTSVLPQMDFTRPGAVDPVKIIAAINRFEVTTMFGSPALLRRVARYGIAAGTTLPSLKRVISAGAPVAATTLEDVRRLLPADALIHTPYGATEALPVCTIDSTTILTQTRQRTDQGAGICVGYPVPGTDVKIVRISDREIDTLTDQLLLGEGDIGEITVSGPQVTQSYYGRPAATALAKISDPRGGTVYHRMGDLGYRDAQGRIWFCGRKAHRVECATGTLFTIPCEAVFNTHPQVFRTALVGVKVKGSQVPLLCVELEEGTGRSEHARILKELRDLAGTTAVTREIERFLIHPAFPVDIRHNAKIFREKLALWAQRRVRE
jgi:acyl-CoA synthetase (AMP-forming)/AMP-acid ligase II